MIVTHCFPNILDQGIELAQYCYANYCIPRPNGYIAPSRNALDRQTSRQRASVTVSDVDQKVIETAKMHQLQIPVRFDAPSDSDHCVSMSLRFLQHYKDTKNVEAAAQKMACGADKTCAQGTMLYHSLYTSNVPGGDEQLLYKLKSVVARLFGMMFKQEVFLHIPVENIYAYFTNDLAPGEYIIVLPNHVMALVKDEQNRVYHYDPDQGTFQLINNSKWFLRLLVDYKVHLSERLTLFRVQEAQTTQNQTIDQPLEKLTKIEAEQSTLTFENMDESWGVAEFKWRGKTYRFVRDNVTGEIYNGDPTWLIRFKCLMLCPGTVIAATARTVGHVAVGIFHLLSIPFCAYQGKKRVLVALKKSQDAFLNALRAPLYGVLGIGAALYGILRPYEGRKLYGYLERCLNRQNDRVDRHSAYYMALCFIPLNFNAPDKHNKEMTIEQLKRTIQWSIYFRKVSKGKL